MYSVKLIQGEERPFTVGDLNDGELAIISGQQDFAGELFFRNVMGFHSISNNRYWPSEYAAKKGGSIAGSGSAPLYLKCRRIESGDVLKFS